MNTVAIVQARLNSARFPCKVLADLCGRPMLSHVLERASAIRGVDRVVLAVPTEDVNHLKHLWPYVYGGPEKHVLLRYHDCAQYYNADVVVRVTGDCPLLAPDISSRALKTFNERMHGEGYLACCQPYVPTADGWDTEVFSFSMLRAAYMKARASQREHVTTWMREKDDALVATIKLAHDYSMLKLSVDTRDDLTRVKLVMQFLHQSTDFGHDATYEAWLRAGKP